MPERVLIAMSGGVDSAVAAARLVESGFEAVGVTLHLWDYPDDAPEKTRCCAPEDAHDARLVADHLKMAHYTFDRRELFAEEVVAPFVRGYLAGQTPSPCVACNRAVKMRELFALAERLGAARVATGHYARVERRDGAHRLFRGRDEKKDQSYFLHMLSSAELGRLVLPLGDATKEEVRAEARARALPGAEKGESQELCFVPAGDYAAFVEARADGRIRPGAIVDGDGRALARHDGIHRFTVGQRRGLNVALGRPAYVTRIDPERGEVVVGERDQALALGAELEGGAWSDDVVFPLRAAARVRSHHRPVEATFHDGGRRVRFHEPVAAVAPGQYAVAYDGERVLGGATIVRALADTPEAPRESGPTLEGVVA